MKVPIINSPIAAGFPSPADDHAEKSLDLNEHLIKHPTATFIVRVHGNSMVDVGIFNNDLLIVDRSLAPNPSDVVVAVLNGEFTVKTLTFSNGQTQLTPQCKNMSPLIIKDDDDFMVWGVVTHCIHSLQSHDSTY